MNEPCPRSLDQHLPPRYEFWWGPRWTPGKEVPTCSRTEGGVTEVLEWGVEWDPKLEAPPLTCSYCGGIRPQDALRLVAAGWEVEATGKPYKRYLHPPGFSKYCEAIYRDALDGKEASPTCPEGFRANPIPCVKLYVFHLNEEEIQRFNHILKSQVQE